MHKFKIHRLKPVLPYGRTIRRKIGDKRNDRHAKAFNCCDGVECVFSFSVERRRRLQKCACWPPTESRPWLRICARKVSAPSAIRWREYRPTANLKQEIDGGAPFDVVIVTVESIEQLSKEGKITAGEGTPISRVGVGIGIRKGAPRPDISTPDALKRAMLGTKAIAYGPVGASLPYINKMLETLGITDTMKPKTLFFNTSDETNEAVAEGKADFGMTLVSEILPAKGVELLGPFPDRVARLRALLSSCRRSKKS